MAYEMVLCWQQYFSIDSQNKHWLAKNNAFYYEVKLYRLTLLIVGDCREEATNRAGVRGGSSFRLQCPHGAWGYQQITTVCSKNPQRWQIMWLLHCLPGNILNNDRDPSFTHMVRAVSGYDDSLFITQEEL